MSRVTAAERILVIRIAAIGDVANSSTVVGRIRAERPGAHVTWMCGRGSEPLVRLFDVDDVITVDDAAMFRGGLPGRVRAVLGVWRALMSRRFDLVLLLHPDRRYRYLIAPLLGTRVHAFVRAPGPHANPIPDRFRGDEAARLLDGMESRGPIVGHYPLADVRARLPGGSPLPVRTVRRVTLVPGGARNALRDDPLRRWPVERYAAVARMLLAEGAEVVLAGGPEDAWVRPAFAGLAAVDMIGTLSLVETLAALRDSDVVVAHDTGPMHLARLVRTPLVALFGPTMPRQALSIDETTTVLWGGAHLACRPCYDQRDYALCRDNLCIQDISVAAVLAAVRDR